MGRQINAAFFFLVIEHIFILTINPFSVKEANMGITENMQVELHVHTTASLSDGVQTYKDAINEAIRKGIKSIAITNHGTAADIIDALIYADKKNFHLIVGIESYIAKSENLYDDEEKEDVIRQHLILLVKDVVGYQAFCRYITDTNRNIDSTGRAVGTIEMLKKHFGPGSAGHGHVIGTSACFAGPLANTLLFNERVKKELTKINARIARSEETLGPEYADAKKKVAEVTEIISKNLAEIEKLTPEATKKFSEAKKAIKAEKDDDKKEQLQLALDIEMLKSKDAKDKIIDLKEINKKLNVSISAEKKLLTSAKGKEATIAANKALAEKLASKLKSKEELYAECIETAREYAAIFGYDDFYGEVQYHGWETEAYVYPLIFKVSREIGIKVIATNDVHMTSKDDLRKRELAINLIGISKKYPYRNVEKGDAELYLKDANEKFEFLKQILSEEDALLALATAGDIANECTFNLKELESLGKHYPSYVNATTKLRELAETGYTKAYLEDGRFVEIEYERGGIKARYGETWNEKHRSTFEYELGIIDKMGFSSYFLYIADVICKCKKLYGTPIGPGRGSGVGSIVCYLAGITELEPTSLDLLFERFLNPERVSMPDIDTDFSKEARAFAIKYVTEFYGERKVAGILTKAKMGPKNALTYAPKLYAKSKGLDVKTFASIGTQLKGIAGEAKTLEEIEDAVKEKFAANTDALGIFEDAKRLEGLTTSYGQHAAGIISIMNNDVEDFIPLMMAADAEGNQKMVIQADMVAAEANLGFIKFDFLGLKNLNIITACQKMIEERYGKYIDIYSLGYNDKAVYDKIFKTADTNFVFQFESGGMKKMLKDLKPESFGDLVMAVSVYRPGPMDFIPDIIRCKETGEKSEIVTRIPILEDVLRSTYGFPIYQEQVMKIMTIAAGFSTAKADNVRRYMSKKKEAELAATRPEFIEGCKSNGINAEDAEWLFDQLMPFAKYGFNKSHAAAYSYISYVTAYLKLYYPAEFLCSAMLEQGEKTLQFLSDCKKYNIEVLPVSVNMSQSNYSVESEGVVRIGLSAIKGLKAEADKIIEARKSGLYADLKDFIIRSNIKSNSLEACILSGACDEFVTNREIANGFAACFSEKYNSLLSTKETLDNIDEESEPKRANLWKTKYEAIKAEIDEMELPKTFALSMKAKTSYETKYLGMWMSGSPLDDYDLTLEKYQSLEDVGFGDSFTTIGVVSEYRKIKTKNNDDMCFFELLDKDSKNIPAVVFPKVFDKIPEIEDNMVIEVTGVLGERDDEPQIEITKIVLADNKSEILTIDATNTKLFVDVIIPLLKEYSSDSGYETKVCCVAGEMRSVRGKVNKDIVSKLVDNDINFYVD